MMAGRNSSARESDVLPRHPTFVFQTLLAGAWLILQVLKFVFEAQSGSELLSLGMGQVCRHGHEFDLMS